MKRFSFTLVEMLVVLVITGVLLGLAMPAFEHLTVGSGVDAGARMVGAQLRLARQYAITSRKRIALLMPRDDEIGPPAVARHYTQFRACEYSFNGVSTNFVAWIPNTKWETLPTGAIIARMARSMFSLTGPGDPPTDTSPEVVSNVPGFALASPVRAILFKPNGQLEKSVSQYVWLAEGFPTGTNIAKVRNTKNVIAIYVDVYTGRISYPDLNSTTNPVQAIP